MKEKLEGKDCTFSSLSLSLSLCKNEKQLLFSIGISESSQSPVVAKSNGREEKFGEQR